MCLDRRESDVILMNVLSMVRLVADISQDGERPSYQMIKHVLNSFLI